MVRRGSCARAHPRPATDCWTPVPTPRRCSSTQTQIHTRNVREQIEDRIWPIVAHMPKGMVASFSYGLVIRILWLLERREGRRRKAPAANLTLRRTEERLEEKLQALVRAANWRERLRRSTNVARWVVQGLVSTPELAAAVAKYEVRSVTRVPSVVHEGADCSYLSCRLNREPSPVRSNTPLNHFSWFATPRPARLQARGRTGNETIWTDIVAESLRHGRAVNETLRKLKRDSSIFLLYCDVKVR